MVSAFGGRSFRSLGSGFRVLGLGFRGSGFRGSGFRGSGFIDSDSEVQGSEVRVHRFKGSRFYVQRPIDMDYLDSVHSVEIFETLNKPSELR
jgi:hypothetical protein